MFRSQTSITINRSPADVFRFITDLSKFNQWRSGNIATRQLSAGAIGSGSTFQEEFWLMKPFRGKATYQVLAHEVGKSWTFETTESPVKAKQSYSVEPIDNGARLTLITDGEMKPKFLESMFRGMSQREIENTALKIKSLLEAKT